MVDHKRKQGMFRDKYENSLAEQTQESLLKEVNSVHMFNTYCNDCNVPIESKEEYEYHQMEMHNQRKPLHCDACSASFTRHDHLKRHIQSLHMNQEQYCCPVCGKDCGRQDILVKHIKKTHSNSDQVLQCQSCQVQFQSLPELEKHIFSHMAVERHACPHCDTSFKRRDHMLRHIKTGHMNQSIMCPICGQIYKRRDHVTRHVREKHKMSYVNGQVVKPS